MRNYGGRALKATQSWRRLAMQRDSRAVRCGVAAAAVTFAASIGMGFDPAHRQVYLGAGLGIASVAAVLCASFGQSRRLQETRETLAQTEERLGLTLKSTGVSVWNWDILSNHVQGDENAAAQFGISLDQFPRSIAEFAEHVHPDDRERVQQEVAAALEQQAPYSTEFRTVWPDGAVRWLFSRGKVYRDSTGRPLRFTGVCLDVTERREAEKKLRAATQKLATEARFRQLLEAAPDAVVVTDRLGTIVLVNAQAESLFEYRRDEMLGRKIELLVPERYRELHTGYRTDYFVHLYQRSMRRDLDLYARRKNGTELAVEISLSPIETEDGTLVYSTIRDISDRKRAERGRDQIASIVNYSDDAIIGKTLDGIILNWNRGAERLYGYASQEVVGKPISILLPPGQDDDLVEIMASLKRGEVIKKETVRLRKDGTTIDIALTISPIKSPLGEITAASAIARDISERKRAEEQILILNRRLEHKAAEAQAASLAKSTFLSTMSHEIRTPMNAILGYTQLMERDRNLGPESRANLKIIGRSGEHLLAIINDVLDMSKIEAGRVELRPVTFHLARLLEELASMFRLRAQAKALEFDLLTGGETVPYIVADEGKTRQVLINLLGNAVKFTSAGWVRLQAAVEARDAGRLWLAASISDSGPGMTEGEQAKLFEPFCQSGGALNVQQGTGLGLAISRKYARLMGGDLTVKSAPGHGSTFRFEIPIGRGEANPATTRSLTGRAIGIRAGQEAPQILVVDDHEENRSWLIKLLSSIGFQVRGAKNGETAIEIWEQWQPQLILMDIHMPGVDGLEATRRIKASTRGKKTVVIALTASALEEDRQFVKQSGADDFLAKPCSEDELLEKIAFALGIEYDYEQIGENPLPRPAAGGKITSSHLRQLPPQTAAQLLDATLSGNRRALNQLILAIRDVDGGVPAQALQELADRYEYDTLTQLLEEACQC